MQIGQPSVEQAVMMATACEMHNEPGIAKRARRPYPRRNMTPVFHISHLPGNFSSLLIQLRHLLHRHPELSGMESDTPRLVREFISRFSPDEVIAPLGGNGLAAVYRSDSQGPTLVFRAELDALPVQSGGEGSAALKGLKADHRCGHDGHMSMVAGLAPLLHYNPPRTGRVVLLFQPGEETGRGALQVVDDPQFDGINPDYVFALHNLPGHPVGKVLVKAGLFSYASVGMHLRLIGKESHASHPEQGLSPAPVMCGLIDGLPGLARSQSGTLPKALLTIVHATLGKESFGTSPGNAVIMATLRAESSDKLNLLRSGAVALVNETAEKGGLRYEISWMDEFSEGLNSETAAEIVAEAARRSGLAVRWLAEPFRWSEDFGQFTARYKGAMFVLGAGEHAAPLHSAEYEFPDALLEPGTAVFWNIIDRLLNH